MRVWFFRIAFFYGAVLLVVLAAGAFQSPDTSLAGQAVESLGGIFLPLVSTTAMSFLLALDVKLDHVMPLKMLASALGVVAGYSLGRWAARIDFGFLVRMVRAPSTAGLAGLPVAVVYSFIPVGAAILAAAALALLSGLADSFKN